jgi:hypothetical protein
MGLYAKRDVIRSLDFLLYCQFAYMYLLDASLLVLLFRILMQLVSIQDVCSQDAMLTHVNPDDLILYA